MEEDGGVKAAPVTRLRRRLSVEQSDDTKSPSVSAPSTPTKKRGGRLAAKPQLELIDENAIQNSPKRATRKSIARDITEAEEKPVTPARRSTRVKSNTSLVSETEEKVLTPSRRSTRTKSNTSIVLETALSVEGGGETPRAKRAAARRNSQAGSDTEVYSLTPARTRRTRKGSTSSVETEGNSVSETVVTPGRTRRTRKGSTSSIDVPVEGSQAEKPVSLITEVISEEPEAQIRKSTSHSDQETVENKDDSPSLRKSPRLKAKKERKSKGRKSDAQENIEETQNVNDNKEPNLITQKETQNHVEQSNSVTEEVTQSVTNTSEKDLSVSSANLIKNLEPTPKKKTADKNKSYSDIETSDSKSKRHRTKSWTTLCATPQNEGNFYSDNEATIKKLKKHGKIFNDKKQSESGLGDGPQKNVDLQKEKEIEDLKDSKKRRKKSLISDGDTPNKSVNNTSITDAPKEFDVSNESNKENLLGVAPTLKDSSSVELLFDKPPTGEITSLVFMEDSDSNTDIQRKQDKVDVVDGEDQCVPVVLQPTENQTTSEQSVFAFNTVDEVDSNTSCEPMDIDETMPENVSLTEGKQSRKSSLCMPQDDNLKNKIKSSISTETLNNSAGLNISAKGDLSKGKQSRKSSLCIPQEENENKSKRKSSHSMSEMLDKSVTVNKSIASPITYNDKSLSKSRKSSLSKQEADSISEESHNLSKRKSSITQELDRSGNENKSTLVLSQIKDLSAAETSASKSLHKDNNLSKSINTEGKEGPSNKNLALNYLTSTPVQQKNAEKLRMQMNTSVITPTNENKDSKKNTSIKNNSKSKVDSSDEEETEESEGESSQEKSKLLIAEAEDAGEDYESGDSQDEDERRYEMENEIVERGETLNSEEEYSNDSDYEKDSFLVSSDEEDNELLSGSEDDLDMSDNELTMSAKSKKKFNDRKEKQQKKASKKMYEARHGLNDESGENDKSEVKPKKKNNRLRLDSTLLESGDDNKVPPKKNKRMRLESTLDSSQDNKSVSQEKTSQQDTSIASEPEGFVHKKKKTKCLSESICIESILNEKEITIVNDIAPADDPLIVKVKPEPKTPQKDLEISTIHFTDREEIEQIGVDENVSMMKANETSDPLQKTMAQDEDSDSDDSISENEDITNNYESMLKELNNESTKQIKTQDISLNLEKKVKAKNSKQAILDELNITEIKSPKNKDFNPNEKTVKRLFKKLADTEDSSDSVDLKLLFSDDSNGSEKHEMNSEKVEEVGERIIPLKRTEGTTNIPGSNDSSMDNIDGVLNASSKKTKKRKSKAETANADNNANIEEELPFFIDTKGDLPDNEINTNKTFNSSSKKKDKNNSVPEPVNGDGLEETDSNDAPAEVTYVSEKNKKRNKKLSESIQDVTTAMDDSTVKTPGSEKKKKKKNRLTTPEDATVTDTIATNQQPETNANIELTKEFSNITSSSKKKTKKSSESQDGMGQIKLPVEKSPSKAKKNKNKVKESKEANSEVSTDTKLEKTDTTAVVNNLQILESNEKKRKRKSSANVTAEEIIFENATAVTESDDIPKSNASVGNKKKKLKTSNSTEDNEASKQTIVQEVKASKVQGSKKDTSVETVKPEQSKPTKKRKERDYDDAEKKTKIPKENSFDNIHVPRLPPNIINQLEDKPNKEFLEKKKAKFTSTTDFIVENTITKRSKPSSFLEETVYLNDDEKAEVEKKNAKVKKPKVLPFLPTVSTSDSGFTTKFQVNVISQKMEFIAQSNDVPNFKTDYLRERRIKKLRTYDVYKKQRSVKLSKF